MTDIKREIADELAYLREWRKEVSELRLEVFLSLKGLRELCEEIKRAQLECRRKELQAEIERLRTDEGR